MIHLANAVLAFAQGDEATALHERLNAGSYAGPCLGSGAEAIDAVRRLEPDILLIGPELDDGMDPVDLARAVRADAEISNTPVCLLVRARTAEVQKAALDAGIEEIIVIPDECDEIMPRIRPLVRVATMHLELKRRAEVVEPFGIDVPGRVNEPVDEGPCKVIALPYAEGDLDSMKAALGADMDLTVAETLYHAEDMITEHNFDAAVMFAGDDVGPILDLCTQIRNNPRLFNLPVILVHADGAVADRADAYRRGVSRILSRPLDLDHLKASVLTMVRRQRMRWTIRLAIEKTAEPPVLEPRTKLYNQDFLNAYLADRLAHSKTQQKHLSVIVFYFPNLASATDHYGEEAARHLLVQLGQWITKLVRVEDPTSLVGPRDEFVVVLPDTPLDEAQIVMHRIAGVLAYTDFAIHEVYEVVKVWPQVGATTAGDDDTVDSILSRAREALA